MQYIIENPYNHLVSELDDSHLGQVIQIICANAAFSTPQGTVRAKYEYRNKMLTIIIEDTGIGIGEEALQHIFERFSTSKDHPVCGTGLELPIAHSMIEQMGGHIEMMSELGKGTTAWITIPCEATELDKKKDFLT